MKIIFTSCNAFVIIFLCAGVAYGAFEDMGIGARPLGMGGAFVAVADDTNAATHNPAGLGYITVPAAGFTHVRMFSGAVTYNYASIVFPLSAAGTLGANFGMISEESGIYSENNVALSYSIKLLDALSLGVNLKMLNTKFDKDSLWVKENPYFAETSASAFTLDLGILARPVVGLNIGLSGENLAPASISISESDEEKVPVNLRLGLGYKLSAIAASVQQPALKETLSTAIISVEGAMRKERGENAVKLRTGIEAWFVNKTVALRAGYRIKKRSSSATVGGSIRIPITDVNIQLDYALQIFGGDIEDNLTHRVSLSVSL